VFGGKGRVNRRKAVALQKDIGKRKKTSDTFCIRGKKRKRGKTMIMVMTTTAIIKN